MKRTHHLFCLLFPIFILLGCENVLPESYEQGFIDCSEAFKAKGSSGMFNNISCLEGYRLPEFRCTTIQNDSISDRTLIRMPSVINFWFIGCKPCEKEIPGLSHLSIKYESKVNFIAIGKNSIADIEDFLDTHNWPFQHISDPDQLLIRERFKLAWGFPTTIITDKNGVIVKAFCGGSSDSTAVQKIIKEIEPTLQRLLAE